MPVSYKCNIIASQLENLFMQCPQCIRHCIYKQIFNGDSKQITMGELNLMWGDDAVVTSRWAKKIVITGTLSVVSAVSYHKL